MSKESRINVFIIGSKGIPAHYGGFETFVEKLTENRKNTEICYHVACAVDEEPQEVEFEYNGAHCFRIKRRPLGAARAIFYDVDALDWAIDYVREHNISSPIFYVLACRIGPFIASYAKKIHELGGVLFINPDGHEWMRAKWSGPVRRYWKMSESQMVKHADLIICDSKTIENYIHDEYRSADPKTTYIAYGADTIKSTLANDSPEFKSWLQEHDLRPYEYYLVVGRFVPENNYEIMIREFMASDTTKKFALITEVDDGFLRELEEKTHFSQDDRIKFVGTVYDQELLKKIRECAFAYFHGHEVGGTNPSLLEALAATQLNLLLDVGFNREVAEDNALYWSKDKGSLAQCIGEAEQLEQEQINDLDERSTKRIEDQFSWDSIADLYEQLFTQTAESTL